MNTRMTRHWYLHASNKGQTQKISESQSQFLGKLLVIVTYETQKALFSNNMHFHGALFCL